MTLGLVQQAIYSLSNSRKLIRTNWPLTGVVYSPLGTLQLKVHVCYFVLMVGLLHYLYSLHADFYT